MFSLLQLEKPSLVVMTPCYVAMRIGGRVRSLDHCCVVKVTQLLGALLVTMPFISLSIDRKIAVYEAQIVSIIMYNCSSWSPTAKSLEKLDICHRRHLRALLNIRWPQCFITNVDLYNLDVCLRLFRMIWPSEVLKTL